MYLIHFYIIFLISFVYSTPSETPPGNLTDLSICKVSHLGLEYSGDIAKTESNVRCQAWTSNSPHKVDESFGDDKFPFRSKKMSKNYCRNPDKKSMGPWCYTMNSDLIDEICSVPLCSYSECRLTGPGMEYGGSHDKGVSDRQCLKWDKERKKVLVNGNYTKYGKFAANLFPDSSVSKAKKFCRNPDGDMGGPWCFVENDELGYVEREYCDIPFCFDPECSVFAKNYDTYMHYTDLNGSVLTDMKFGIKLWDSDSTNEASARLVLSVLALPLTGQEINDLGVGIEIFISNKESALRYGNKDKPEYEPTPGILTSTNFTTFTLNWDRGFITFGIEGQVRPIFLAEMKTKNNLMGFQKDRFDFYSVQGTNVVWSFPFCLDDDGCDVQTTTGGQFQQFWPLRQKDIVFDLYVYVRAFRSASILVTPSPTVDFPYFKIVFLGPNGFTRVTIKEYLGASEVVLKEIQLDSVVDYWSWGEFSISFFANSLQIYMKKVAGMHSLLEATNEVFRVMRWFSVSSENTVAHWSFYCQPPAFAQPPKALLPECAINTNEPDYTGTQDITSAGLPCLPWSGKKLLPDDVTTLFKNESSILSSKNYCRDPGLQTEGTFCYALTQVPTKKVEKAHCRLRKCKSQQCKMAGTGNDFIGHLTVTRSGRRCDAWDLFPESVHPQYMYSFNGSLFAEMNSRDAKNYCRNPNRDISGQLALYKVYTQPRGTEPMLNPLMEKQISHLMSTSNWTKFYITWSERIFDIKHNNDLVLHYESDQPILVYWFSVAAVVGWVTWSANCEPLDLDGPPIDGGWSAWSPWTCSVSCGGGQGFRTRTCSNPHPNIFGKLCEGNPTATGVCNDFPCGDISPDTLDKIREKLKNKAYSFIIDEDSPILLMNDREMLKVVKKESPEAYFEWTLNGVFVNVDDRVSFLGDDIMIKAAKPQDAGTYVCMIYRINDRRVILKVITLAVRAKKFDVDTRATLSYTLQCHSVILGYVYADLSLKLTLNNKTFLDHGLTTLAAVNVNVLDPLNRSESGDWKCVVEQKDLKLKWITNYVKLNVKKKPNFYTHLMEDKLTAPFFGLFKSEEAVLGAVIFITVLVFIVVVVFLFVYFKFCTLQSRYKRNRRL